MCLPQLASHTWQVILTREPGQYECRLPSPASARCWFSARVRCQVLVDLAGRWRSAGARERSLKARNAKKVGEDLTSDSTDCRADFYSVDVVELHC